MDATSGSKDPEQTYHQRNDIQGKSSISLQDSTTPRLNTSRGLPTDWEPLSLAQLAVRYPVSTEELMEEFRITPSSSDETICLDETENREEISHVKVYNVFKD